MDVVVCPACLCTYPRLSIHSCHGPVDQKHFTGIRAQVPAEELTATQRRRERISILEALRPRFIDYLRLKMDAADWHGVQDVASDLRDLEFELAGLRYPAPHLLPEPTGEAMSDETTSKSQMRRVTTQSGAKVLYDQLVAMLRSLEWAATLLDMNELPPLAINICPTCGARKPRPHLPDCQLASLLRELP